jgi:hypothetical protein
MTSRILTLKSPAEETTSVATIQELTWWMPMLLFVAGWVTYVFRTNTGFEMGAALGTVVVLRAIYLVVVKCHDVRFCWVISCGLLLGYALGTLNTALQLFRKHETVASHFRMLQDDLSNALSVVFWVCAILFLAGAILEKPIHLDRTKLLKTDVSYVFLGFLIYLGALATGQIGYMGANVSDDHHVTVLSTISGMMAPTLPAFTVLLRDKSTLLRNKLLFWLLLLVEIALLVPLGRRMIIYSVLCVIIAFTIVGDRWRGPIWKKVAVLTVCTTGFYVANTVFFAMRHVAEVEGSARRMGAPDLSLTELVTRAIKFIREGRDSGFDEEMATNLQDRTFVLPYFAELLSECRTHAPLHGRLILFSVSTATPTAIYSLFGDKSKVLDIGMEEMIANPAFGLAPRDEANSLLTSGISDFGLLGIVLFPIGVALLINFAVRIVLARTSELTKFVALMIYIHMLFQTEMSITSVICNTRNVALLLIGWNMVAVVGRFFMKSPNKVPNPLDKRGPSSALLVRYHYQPASRIR